MLLLGIFAIVLLPVLAIWSVVYFDLFKINKEKADGEKMDLRNYKPLFLGVALVASIGFSAFAIGFDFSYDAAYAKLVENEEPLKTVAMFVPPTRIKDIKPPKPKPKPEAVEFKEEEIEKIIDEVPELPSPQDEPELDSAPIDDGDGAELDFTIDDEPVWDAAVPPEFPGGDDAMLGWIMNEIDKNLTPRAKARITSTKRIAVQLVIEKDGSITNVRIPTGQSSLISEVDETIEAVIRSMPKWSPGLNASGFPVRLNYIIPVVLNVKN